MTGATSEAEVPTSNDKAKGGDSGGEGRVQPGTEESRSKAAVVAVACPLRIQPDMHSNTIESSSKRPVARAKCSYKSFAPRSVLRRCLRP
jgi:hypothetical protein